VQRPWDGVLVRKEGVRVAGHYELVTTSGDRDLFQSLGDGIWASFQEVTYSWV
jgi:hypothetical protein